MHSSPKSVSICIVHITQAWEEVRPETIKRCFRKTGILDSDFSVVSRSCEGIDPIEDVDFDVSDTSEIGGANWPARAY